MNKRDEMNGLMMLFRTMSGEEDVISHMEQEGIKEAINSTMLSKKMTPSKEEWEKLGFVFIDTPEDDILCRAKLPDGWRLEHVEDSLISYFIDENGFRRGMMFYKSAFYDRKAIMNLNCRYAIYSKYVDEMSLVKEVYFGTNEEKIFIAGQVQFKENPRRKERIKFFEEEDRLKQLAEEYAKEYYPDWENIDAYWNDDVQKVKKIK